MSRIEAGQTATGTHGVHAIDEITADWVETVLLDANFANPGVTGFSTSPVGTGQAATCYRIAPEYRDARTELPRSIIAKFPARDAGSARSGAESGTYMREVNFYRFLQSDLTIRTPQCYLAEIEGDGPQFALLLEDLSPAQQGDQIAGCGAELARAAALELVGLHAPSWQNPAMLGFDWVTYTSSPGRSRLIMDIYRRGLPSFMERCAQDLSAEEVALIERIGRDEDFPSEYPMIKSYCLTHNDYRLDNFLIELGEGSTGLHVVDWQTFGVGNPMRDMSYFLGGCLLPDLRAAVEKDIVMEYHDRLLASGATGYSWDECWSDYRRASYHGLMNAMAGMIFVTRTERGDQLFTTMARRHARQALELGAEEFLG